MRYSTHPARDRWRVCVLTVVAFVGCYLCWGLIPFGIKTEPSVSNQAGLSAADLDSLLLEAGARTFGNGFKKVYIDTFLRPWERSYYRNSIAVEGGTRVFSVRMISTHPGGSTWVGCKASRKDEGWETWDRKTVMQRICF